MAEFTREGAFDHRPDPPTLQVWKGDWIGGVAAFVLLLAMLMVAYSVYVRDRSRDTTPAPAAEPSSTSEFRVPSPGDAEYADYLEMLEQPMFRSSVEHSPGYAPPYDPEWRSVLTGRRSVGPVDLEFVNGARSLEELGRFVMLAALDGDGQALVGLAVNKDEFELILWPEFPQSRPYLRIPAEEGWSFHYSDLTKGISRGGLALTGKPYTFVGIRSGSAREYANFRLLEDVVLICRDESTGRTEEFAFAGTVAERNGRFKVYLYEE